MGKNYEYSAALTSDAFLYYEFKQILKLKREGLSDDKIRKKVIEENIFQYKSRRSIIRLLSSVMRRVKLLDDYLIKLALEDDLRSGKIINLYLIMKTSRIFYEFMNEVIREKLDYNCLILEKKDINEFFTHKAEQSEIVLNWTEKTTAKLKQVILKILKEAGMLEDIKTGKINRLIIPQELKDYLIKIGDGKYIRALGEKLN
ncbi:MAG: DUF1819 family protein [Caloramator sp.]|nr:DUF1819 family protein [Caloramator sp.]